MRGCRAGLVGLLALACASPPPLEVSSRPSAEVPAVLTVDVAEPGRWRVVVDGEGPVAPDRVLDVRGRPAGEAFDWWVEGEDADGRSRSSERRSAVVPEVPDDFPTLALEVDGDPGFRWLAGTLVLDDRAAMVVIDAAGRYVWWAEDPPGQVLVTPEAWEGPDGPVLGWLRSDMDPFVDAAAFVEVPLSGASRATRALPGGHHDAVRRADGSLLFLAKAFADHALDGVVVPMASDEVRVVAPDAPDGDPGERLWSTFDALPIEARGTCTHIRTPTDELGHRDVREWTHGNSLLEVDGAVLVNARYTDWLYALDATSGELRWVMNGFGSTFRRPDGGPLWTSPSDTALWSHAHLSDAWSGGALVFDNGDHHDPQVSRVLEVSWDEEAGTAEAPWSYDHPEGGHAGAVGDARRVGDDVLVTWAGLGTVEVVTHDHDVRWRLRLSHGMLGRVLVLDRLYPDPP